MHEALDTTTPARGVDDRLAPGGALRSKPSPDAFPLDPEPPRPRRARPYAAGRRGRRYHREPANAEEITVIDVGVVSAEVPP